MKLIIQNIGSVIYVYRESNKQFAATEPSRGKRLEAKLLDNECNVLQSLPVGSHLVFDLKKDKKAKAKAKK